MSAIEVVTNYFEWMDGAVSGDSELAEKRTALVSPDIKYQNVPLRPISGLAEYNEFAMSFVGTEFMRGQITHIAQEGEWVLMERNEEWRLNGVTVGGMIMGIMRVVDGQIVEWTDYQANFSTWRFSGQMPEAFWARWEFAPAEL
ncbi:MAG: hypothetical protein EOP31_11425 [Rhodococcus sp. (in: high G+C Gram-positive bacteria)]|uniref:limonene-1,2-epoxide hydrolase family protein n=1 Tax=Rhodococcus sp. TaxID=1831 RepID=UPI0011F9F073|nr:limonene-1,2-epoxide hydrolase family protein [Rhodococcus sp. (in: high G+C Gram-positive bacteria)]RZL24914.1 MAG: hypothetical protein EOP31_11425 [Rhodococcus sp. (in: high G+C Gram-positive bacteria)]